MLNLNDQPDQPLVAVSVLSADFGHIARDAQEVLGLGGDLLHIDVMDGHFAGNLTMGVDMIAALRRHVPEAYLDTHLMVDQPAMFVEPFAKAGANNFTFHLEVCHPVRAKHTDPHELIRMIRDHGMQVGMAINPLTDAAGLEPYLDEIDLALVMSVHPGASGQAFIPDVLRKTQWLAERVKPTTRIQMDGGLSPKTAPAAAKAGCDVMVTASALFGSDDRKGVIDALHASRG